MKKRRLTLLALVCALAVVVAAAAASTARAAGSPAALAETPDSPYSIAPGVDVIFGTYPEGSQPDGNSVIFTVPDGLIVMDTGRHASHTQKILDYASERKLPIKAIINSHWHLDHIGGNSRIRTAFPDARIYASGALEGAIQGFLASYRKDLEGALRQMPDDPQAAGWRDELTIIAAAPQSVADERIESSGVRVIAGRKLDVHLETNAVTAGDVWVFDPTTHVLAAGDLVTLPVPFLDTACPSGWKDALQRIAHERFTTLVPGHGAVMKRPQFEAYQRAYANLAACSTTKDKSNTDCVDGWLHDAHTLIADADQKRARKMMDYYVSNILRGKQERIQKMCAG